MCLPCCCASLATRVALLSSGGQTVSRNYDTLARVSAITASGIQNAGFGFDQLGNLTTRSDIRGDAVTYSEGFRYDTLNRLASASCNNTGVCGAASRSYGYDDFGNLTSKAGTIITYFAGTHRVQSAPGRSFSYQNTGNLYSDTTHTLGWTPFNMPSYIAGSGKQVDFRYDGDHARTVESLSTGKLTLYVGGQFYEQVIEGATVTGRAYIGSPEGVLGVVTLNSAGVTARKHWFKDHLGSVIAERDYATGAVVYLGYDEWGARRGTFNPASVASPRGFAGHEQLDDFTLVHMNGRVYDPTTGRFMSADPLVQAPFDPQSYNRYGYVLNNPLSFTDPSGFSWWTDWRQTIFAIAAAVTMQYYIMPALLAGTAIEGTVAGSMLTSAASGFAAGGIQGGNLQSAIYGALTAAAFYGVGELADAHALGPSDFLTQQHVAAIAGHAAVGCASSAAQGGSCGSGAAAGAFSALGGPVLPAAQDFSIVGVVANAMAGGIGARLAGGSFQNGATTGAFGYLFNAVGENYAAGKAAEARVIAAEEAAGRAVYRQVALTVNVAGREVEAIADYAFRFEDRIVFGEVKLGPAAKLTINQKLVYEALIRGDAVIVNGQIASGLGVKSGVPVGERVALSLVTENSQRAVGQLGRIAGVRAVGGFTALGRFMAIGGAVIPVVDFIQGMTWSNEAH